MRVDLLAEGRQPDSQVVTTSLFGRWEAAFPAWTSGQRGSFRAASGGESLVVSDIVAGDVWLFAGQSNMKMPLSQVVDGPAMAAQMTDPSIRLFQVESSPNALSTADVRGQWVRCTPGAALTFSAVGLLAGKQIRDVAGIPVGLIDATWGGTKGAAWMSRSALLADPRLRFLIAEHDQAGRDLARRAPRSASRRSELFPDAFEDSGNKGEQRGWAREGENGDDWKPARLPSSFAGLGLAANGTVWFRRWISLDEDEAGQPAALELGPIDDWDTTYLNGTEIGRTGASTPGAWRVSRSYRVPQGLLRTGPNLIAIRVHDRQGAGGFFAQDAGFRLALAGKTVPLGGGEWSMRIEASSRQPEWLSTSPYSSHAPASLYESTIRPLTGFGIKGVAWYQGESDIGDPNTYAVLLPALIRSWRRAWGKPRLPFVYVEMPAAAEDPRRSDGTAWARLRESQAAALLLPNTERAITFDFAGPPDLHPKEKRPFAERLGLAVLAEAYAAGPRTPRAVRVERTAKGVVVVTDQAGALRTTDGRRPKGFLVRGAGNWVEADAEIQGGRIQLSSPLISTITGVRHAWADAPRGNTTGPTGLPLPAFRIDLFRYESDSQPIWP